MVGLGQHLTVGHDPYGDGQLAGRDLVAILEKRRIDPSAVNERPISAIEINDLAFRRRELQAKMITREVGIVRQSNLRFASPANDHGGVLEKLQRLGELGTVDMKLDRHVCAPGAPSVYQLAWASQK